MRRQVLSVLSILCVAWAVTVPALPASGTGVCAGVLGTMTTGAPLYYPTTVTLGPGSSSVTQRAPTVTTFALGSFLGTCVRVEGTSIFTKGISVTGWLNGWCGHSAGVGTTSNGYRVEWVSVGTVLVMTSEVTGVATATPDVLNAENCNTGADHFIVNFLAVLRHCQVLKQKVWTTVTYPIPLSHHLLPIGTQGIHVTTEGGTMNYTVKACVSNPVPNLV